MPPRWRVLVDGGLVGGLDGLVVAISDAAVGQPVGLDKGRWRMVSPAVWRGHDRGVGLICACRGSVTSAHVAARHAMI